MLNTSESLFLIHETYYARERVGELVDNISMSVRISQRRSQIGLLLSYIFLLRAVTVITIL